jgi:hypothetical protein
MKNITVRKVYDPGTDGERYVAIVQNEDGLIEGVQIHISKNGAISRAKKDSFFYLMHANPDDEVVPWEDKI